MGFFDALLPKQGILYLITKHETGKTRHYSFTDIEALKKSASIRGRHIDTYFALASYSDPIKDEKGKIRRRTHEQVLLLKSLWLDLDCKDAEYKNKAQAAKAVAALCKALKIPSPIVVDSGGGLHVYWPLAKETDRHTWKEVAVLFRAIRRHVKFRSDPPREVDESSILRVPGTLNHKYNPPAPVRVVTTGSSEYWTIDTWRQHLGKVAEMLGVEVQSPRSTRSFGHNDDLSSGLFDDVPVDADLLLEQCQQVQHMKARQGDVLEPHWRLVIGLLKHCENGLERAHEWSRGPKYDPDALRDRWERWEVGPPLCQTIRNEGEGSCDGCEWWGKISTPLQLGRKPPEPKPTTVVPKKNAKPVQLPPFPKGYEYKDGLMVRWTKGSKGTLVPNPFCYDELHVVRRIKSDNSGAMLRVVAIADGVGGKKFLKTADVPMSLLASGGPEFKKVLGEKEIMASPHQNAWNHLAAFLQDELNRLQKVEEAVPVYSSFGWHDDRFALGNKLYGPDGTVRSAAYMGAADEKKGFLTPEVDSPEQWSEAVDWLYNREGMEPIQYAIACAFGSALGKFQPEIYRGIPLSLVGTGSGRGKTTGCIVATTVFSRPDVAFVNSTLGATVNARNALMSMMQNLPILIDEVTHISTDDLSKLLYAVSNGMDRLRMESTGRAGSIRLSAPLRWNLVTYLTSNSPLVDVLATSSRNSLAELMRIMEINVDVHPLPRLDVREVERRLMQISRTACSAGHPYIRYVVENADKVAKAVDNANGLLLAKMPFLGSGEYRFWRFQASCAIVGAMVAKKLGLLDFDIQHLTNWIGAHISKQEQYLQPISVVDFEEVFNSFLLSMHSQVLFTLDYPVGRDPAYIDESMPRPTKQIVARVVTSDARYGTAVIVLKRYFDQWCSQHRVDKTAFLKWLADNKKIIDIRRMKLGKGTAYQSSSSECYVLRTDGGAVQRITEQGDNVYSLSDARS